jgi:hypothetical protein
MHPVIARRVAGGIRRAGAAPLSGVAAARRAYSAAAPLASAPPHEAPSHRHGSTSHPRPLFAPSEPRSGIILLGGFGMPQRALDRIARTA